MKRTNDSLSKVRALHRLFDQTVALFHRLRAEAERIHRQGELTAARRGVLRGLYVHGPQSVPQMARVRPVSRQHIQSLVNHLQEEDLVEFLPNPAHKKSHLVGLTAKGIGLVKRMEICEQSLLKQLNTGVDTKAIETAVDVLERIRKALETKEWHAIVGERRNRRAVN